MKTLSTIYVGRKSGSQWLIKERGTHSPKGYADHFALLLPVGNIALER